MDHDGNAIAGLLINFFYKYWPELFKDKKIIRVLSPLYIAENKNIIKRFYSKKEIQNEKLDNSWKIKYFKGLGSLGSKEYEFVLNQMEYLEILQDIDSDKTLELVYSSDTFKRKVWLIDEVS